MIFIDRSIPRSVADALGSVRDDVRWLEPEFPHNAPETEWLPLIGQRGWLAIVRDKKIRSRPAERQAIADNGVGCFMLTQKQPLTRWDYLKLIVPTLDEMERLFATTPRPFIFGVGRTGVFSRIA
jgi:hypothetical protein